MATFAWMRRCDLHVKALGCALMLLAWTGSARAQAVTPPPGQRAPAVTSVASSASAAPKPTPDLIYALNSLDANVSVIDAQTWQEVKRIPTGKQPHHLYMTPDRRSILVANALSNSLTLIDPLTGTIQKTITEVPDPYQLQFSSDMKWFVTAANRLHHIDIFRVSQGVDGLGLVLVKRISAPKTPSHIRIDSKSKTAYVTLQDSNQMMSINLENQSVRWIIDVGAMPADVFLTPDDRHALIGLTGDRFVEVWDVSVPKPVLVKRIETGKGAHAFRAAGNGQQVYVSNRAADTISRIDMRSFTVDAQYPAPGGPDCMELMADGKTLMVTSRWARKLTVIDTVSKKVVRQVPLGNSPHGVWTLNHAGLR